LNSPFLASRNQSSINGEKSSIFGRVRADAPRIMPLRRYPGKESFCRIDSGDNPCPECRSFSEGTVGKPICEEHSPDADYMLNYPRNEEVCAKYLEDSCQEVWVKRCTEERSIPKKIPTEYLFCPELMEKGIDSGIVCQRESGKLKYLDETNRCCYKDYNVRVISLFHTDKYNCSVTIFQNKIVIGYHLFLDL